MALWFSGGHIINFWSDKALEVSTSGPAVGMAWKCALVSGFVVVWSELRRFTSWHVCCNSPTATSLPHQWRPSCHTLTVTRLQPPLTNKSTDWECATLPDFTLEFGSLTRAVQWSWLFQSVQAVKENGLGTDWGLEGCTAQIRSLFWAFFSLVKSTFHHLVMELKAHTYSRI